MIVYHGTIAEYAEAIQRDGLKPESTEAFQLESDGGLFLRDVEHVQPHVTTDLAVAKQYAKFRTAYERAARGTWLPGLAKGLPSFEKVSDESKPTASAAVVEFHLPDTWTLTPDRQEPRKAFISKPIPASFVSRVLTA